MGTITAECARGVILPRPPTPPTLTITGCPGRLECAASGPRTAAASQSARSRKCSATSAKSAESGKCSARSAHSGQLGPAPRLGEAALEAALAALMSDALLDRSHGELAAVAQRLATPASVRAIFYEALARRPGVEHPPDDELAVLLELCGFRDVRGFCFYALLSRGVPRVQTAGSFSGLARRLRALATECLAQLSAPVLADACDEGDGWGDWDGAATAPGAAVAVAQRLSLIHI